MKVLSLLTIPGLVFVSMVGSSRPLHAQATNTFPATGSVGIGTTTPHSALEVLGSATYLTLTGTTDSVYDISGLKLSSQTTGNYWRYALRGTQDSTYYNDIRLMFWNAGTSTMYYPITFRASNPTEFAYGIKTTGGNSSFSGNVGIGTSSPSALLSVGSSSQFQVSSSGAISAPSLTASGAVTAATFSGSGSGLTSIPYSALTGAPATGVNSVFGRAGAVTATSGDYSVGQISGAAPLANPAFTGNVGIGTTGPLSPLSVSGQVVIGGPYQGDASLHITHSYGCCGRMTQMEPDGPSQNAVNLVGSTDANSSTSWFTWGVNSGVWTISPGVGFGGPPFSLTSSGNVGIGTTNPGATLEVDGNVKLTTGSGSSITFADGTVQSTAYPGPQTLGGDYAESVDVRGSRDQYEPGDLLVIDSNDPSRFEKASEPYLTRVAGIFSTRPGTLGRRQTTPKNPDEIPMAVVGIVPAKVSAENGPIRPGDPLVSSSTPGFAMKGTDRTRMLGAVVGKAMGNLDNGTGVIEVLVTLQ